MGSVEKRQRVLDYYAATIAGDLDRIADLFSEEVEIWMPPSAAKRGLPIPLVGRDRFVELMRQLASAGSEFWKPTKWTPHVFLFDGDRVAAHVTHEGVMSDGRVYKNDYMFLYRFAGDKICEVREFVDTAWINDFLSSAVSA